MSRIAKGLSLLALAGLFALILLLTLLPQEVEREGPSSYSTADSGRLAVFLVLRELGWQPQAWSSAPGELPRLPAVLWMPEAPPPAPEYLQRAWNALDEAERAGESPRASRRQRDPAHYRRFLEEGGVIVTALDPERRAFLIDELGLLEVESVDRSHDPQASDHQGLVTRVGETLEVRWAGRRWLDLADDRGQVLIADGTDGSPVVVALAIGRGRLVLLPDDHLFDNGNLGAADNGLFLTRIFETLDPLREVYFDEYALGDWTPKTPLELALDTGPRALSLHLVLLLALGVWSLAWVAAFPRDPEPRAQASPSARARSQGAFLARLGRYDLLAGMLRRGHPGPAARRRATARHRGGRGRGPGRCRPGGPGDPRRGPRRPGSLARRPDRRLGAGRRGPGAPGPRPAPHRTTRPHG